jgi:hypothetical protein
MHDESDTPAAATASAMADALGPPLVLIDVLAPVGEIVAGAMAAPAVQPVMAEDRAWARAMLDRLERTAGLDGSHAAECCVEWGPTRLALAALRRSDDAATLVVSASVRPWPLRALAHSEGDLVRRSDRPVLVCSRHPAPAMRVREALSGAPQRAWEAP